MLLKKTMLLLVALVAACSTAVSAKERIDVPAPQLGQGVTLGNSTVAQSQPGPALYPTPVPQNALPPSPGGAPLPMVAPPAAGPIALYDCVKYRQCRKIAPCAVPMVVSVKDPCSLPCDCCEKCVNVEICVPQCECPPTVTTCNNGCKVRYDFGKYAVNITSRRGVVIVDYDR